MIKWNNNEIILIKFMIEMKLTWNKEYCILKPTNPSIKLIIIINKLLIN